jgi:transcription elongation factor Elf1
MIKMYRRLFGRPRIEAIPVKVNSIGKAKFVTYNRRFDGMQCSGVQFNLYILCPTCGKDQEVQIIGGTLREMKAGIVRCRRCTEYLRPRWTREMVRQLQVWRNWARRYAKRQREIAKIEARRRAA